MRGNPYLTEGFLSCLHGRKQRNTPQPVTVKFLSCLHGRKRKQAHGLLILGISELPTRQETATLLKLHAYLFF